MGQNQFTGAKIEISLFRLRYGHIAAHLVTLLYGANFTILGGVFSKFRCKIEISLFPRRYGHIAAHLVTLLYGANLTILGGVFSYFM